MCKKISVLVMILTMLVTSMGVFAGGDNQTMGNGTIANLIVQPGYITATTRNYPSNLTSSQIKTIAYGYWYGGSNSGSSTVTITIKPSGSVGYERGVSSHQAGDYYATLSSYI